MKKLIKILIALFVIFLVFFGVRKFQKPKVEHKLVKQPDIQIDQKQLEQDTQTVKDVLNKIVENQIKDENIVNKYFINKTVEQMSKQLAVYYSQIINFKNNPEKAINLANDIIESSQSYIEAAAIYLEQEEANLSSKMSEIKNNYNTYFFESLFNKDSWRKRLKTKELIQYCQLEQQHEQVYNVLKTIRKLRSLFHLIDWTANSTSPFAWLLRQFII